MDDVPVQNPDQVDALLAISQTIILPGNDRSVENPLAAGKIETMMLEIAAAFGLVPSHYGESAVMGESAMMESIS